MASRLEKRLGRVESTSGARGPGGECWRCPGTVIIKLGDCATTVSYRGGGVLKGPAAARFAAEEEPDGRCPVCGQLRRVSNIGSYSSRGR